MPYKKSVNVSQRRKELRLANPEQHRANAKRHQDKMYASDPFLYKVTARYRDVRSRAKMEGTEFSISFEWLLSAATAAHMRYGFDLSRGDSSGPNLMSLDRFDNLKGYTEENTRVIPLWMNKAKNNFTADQVREVLRYMEGVDTP